MDSSAFQVVLVPVCQGVCYGFIVGALIRFALQGLTTRIDRPEHAGADPGGTREWRPSHSSPQIKIQHYPHIKTL